MRVVATAGHVDHGKSSLVMALTGTDPDRLAEEKRRGLTIDLGFAHTRLTGEGLTGEGLSDGEVVAFVDVPGHVRFLKNMLAGVGGVDACVFVVAATEGWKPQSEEHLRILELLGIEHGIVALTKVDLVDDEWRQLAEMELADRLAGTFLEQAPVVAVSASTGAGLDELRRALAELVRTTPAAADRGRARLWIDRAFAAKGAGTVVTGTLTGGRVRIDDQVVVGPRRLPARVRALQSLGHPVDEIGPGSRVALNLVGVDLDQVRRGDAVVHRDRWHHTARVDASLQVLASLDHDVSRRGAHVAYLGSGEQPVRVRVLGAEALRPGDTGTVRLHLSSPLPLLPGDRYVLRDAGREETVGGGEVLDVDPVLPASRAHPDRRPQRVVAERGWIEADRLELLTGEALEPTIGRWVTSPEARDVAIEALRARIDDAGELGLDVSVLDERDRAVLDLLGDDVDVHGGRARPAGSQDPLAQHPFLAELAAGGCQPPDPVGVDRTELRLMIRRGLVVERDGVCFHPSAIDLAAATAARLVADRPGGFTVAEFRDAIGATRKHALPLLNELDARAVTRRRDDVRIGGPRLPATP